MRIARLCFGEVDRDGDMVIEAGLTIDNPYDQTIRMVQTSMLCTTAEGSPLPSGRSPERHNLVIRPGESATINLEEMIAIGDYPVDRVRMRVFARSYFRTLLDLEVIRVPDEPESIAHAVSTAGGGANVYQVGVSVRRRRDGSVISSCLMTNPSDQPWSARFLLHVLDDEGLAVERHEEEVDLEPGWFGTSTSLIGQYGPHHPSRDSRVQVNVAVHHPLGSEICEVQGPAMSRGDAVL
jgi:hypothetical protein